MEGSLERLSYLERAIVFSIVETFFKVSSYQDANNNYISYGGQGVKMVEGIIKSEEFKPIIDKAKKEIVSKAMKEDIASNVQERIEKEIYEHAIKRMKSGTTYQQTWDNFVSERIGTEFHNIAHKLIMRDPKIKKQIHEHVDKHFPKGKVKFTYNVHVTVTSK